MSDLTETLLRDVREQLGGDDVEWRRAVAVDARAVDEVLATFNSLPKSEVERILAKHNSNIDASIPELFSLYSELNARAQEQARRKQLAETAELLERSFAGIPRAVIEEVLARASGDIEVASEELLGLMRVQQERDEAALRAERDREAKERIEKERQARERLVDHCVVTFDLLSKAEVVEILSANAYDVARSVVVLRERSGQRKLRNLQHVFANVPESHVRAALEACDWNLANAFALLNGSAAPAAPPVPESVAINQTVAAAENAAKTDVLAAPQAKELMETLLREATGPKQVEQPAAVAASAVPSSSPEPVQHDSLKALEEVASHAGGNDDSQKLRVELAVSSTLCRYGDRVVVTSAVSGGEASSYDWIGLFEARVKDNNAPLKWQWFQPQVTLQLPSYGVFEVRYLRKINGKPTCLGVSQPVRCGPGVELRVEQTAHDWIVHCTWDNSSEPVSSSAWIGLYTQGAPDANYLAFNWVKRDISLPVSFLRRLVNGTYEFRLFAHKFQPVAFSQPLVVRQQDSVVLVRENDQCRVVTTLSSIDPAKDTRCWVAICFSNDSRPSAYRRYAYISSPLQTHVFKTPIHTGLYEARIYDSKSKVLAVSDSINIVGV